jgi:hypothetical protein
MPNGIYGTKEDFINRTISDTNKLFMKSFPPFGSKKIDTPEDKLFFFYAASEEKVTDVFAVVYEGQLFFQHKAIYNNRNKGDNNQVFGNMQSFVRVTQGGDNYLYMEVTMTNMMQVNNSFSYKEKGVVWDIKNKEFNYMKNCEDYLSFIQPILPNEIIECEGTFVDIVKERELIKKIK